MQDSGINRHCSERSQHCVHLHAGCAQADCRPKGYENTLRKYHGLWAAPISPYTSKEGAQNSIRFARDRGYPFIGT